MKTILQNYKKEIQKGKIEEVLSKLLAFAKESETENEIILKSANFKALKQRLRSQIIDYETGDIQKNKLILSTLELIDDLIKELDENLSTNQEELTPKTRAGEETILNSPDFNKWISENLNIAIPAVLFFIIYVIAFSIQISSNSSSDIHITSIVHFLFALFALSIVPKARNFTLIKSVTSNEERKIRDNLRITKIGGLDTNEEERSKLWHSFKSKVNESVYQFTFAWLIMWICWVVFYLSLFFNFNNPFWLDFVNYFGTGAFVFMYIVLTESTSGDKYKPFLLYISAIIILIIFFEFAINYKVMGNIYEVNYEVIFWSRLVVGFFACASFSTVFGRLTSKFIDIPWGLIILMFLYASMQPLYTFFDIGSVITTNGDEIKSIFLVKDIALIMAFTLKLVLLLIMTWILRSGRLLFFITQESSINFKEEADLINFFGNILTETSIISKKA